jgi:hypothetical protein
MSVLCWLLRMLGVAKWLRWKIAQLQAKPNKRMRDWATILNLTELLQIIEGKP